MTFCRFDEHGKDHGQTSEKILWVCRQANLKLNKDECLFRCTNIAFFDKITSWQGVSPNLRKVHVLTACHH